MENIWHESRDPLSFYKPCIGTGCITACFYVYLTLILWNSLIYTILKPQKWRHKPGQILYGEYEPQASILCELWLGSWRHLHGFKIV